ncbi:hypothetical protein KCTCHS21_34330 [Cohnella abietis]|uniref:Uncharacterized protein n=1 Tax=Cohnella abietis TaxID=2507935 RepID=A0A3T1D7I5_9BACL|nr:hypothetical protein KCTCHS21_34330 [Cohnella abietis]
MTSIVAPLLMIPNKCAKLLIEVRKPVLMRTKAYFEGYTGQVSSKQLGYYFSRCEIT